MFHSVAVRIAVGVIAALTSLRAGTGLYAYRVTEQLERPSYQVIERLTDGVEIRRYESYLIAETTVDGTGFREPTAEGFRACAGYIFGKNKKRGWFAFQKSEPEKMAMTAPVRIAGGELQKTKVSFVVGKQYSLKTAPTPLNKNVTIRKVPAHTLAVRTFRGPPPADNRVEKERQRLEQALALAGKDIPSASVETLVYGYHDPFLTPNVMRRNEVAVMM